MVSRMTDSIIQHIKEWQNRPLKSIYPFRSDQALEKILYLASQIIILSRIAIAFLPDKIIIGNLRNPQHYSEIMFQGSASHMFDFSRMYRKARSSSFSEKDS